MHLSLIVSLTHELRACHLWQITTGNVRNYFRSVWNANHVYALHMISVAVAMIGFAVFLHIIRAIAREIIIMMICQHQCRRLCMFDVREHWKRATRVEQGALLNNIVETWKVRVSKRKERKINAYFFVAAVASATDFHFISFSLTHTST